MRRTAFVAGGFALVIALAGCGGGSDNASGNGSGEALTSPFGSAQELVLAASAQTEKSRSSKFTLDMPVEGQELKASGEGRYDGENSALSMTVDASGEITELIMVDRVMYVKAEGLGEATGGKPWMKISADGSDPMSMMMGKMFGELVKNTDPAKVLGQVKDAGTITRSEQAELDGQQATHYSIDLEFAKLVDQQAGMGIPQEMLDKMKEKAGDLTLPMELWLNSDQLPLQMTMDMAALNKAAEQLSGQSPPAAADAGKMIVKYTDWGAPVTIEAPPADQVGEFAMPN